MINDRFRNFIDPFRPFLLGGGFLLVSAGCVLLFWVAVLVYKILNSPGDISIVKQIMDSIKAGDYAFAGEFKNPHNPSENIQFYLNWSEPVRQMAFIFIGIVSVGVLARIPAILINSGVSIMKLAAEPTGIARVQNPGKSNGPS